ncbi:hexameric tyrosine-coordinated heme protein [Paracoccus sp. Z118]|uniref:hexameric tyrosine-coordinated heme protein n=1 Tax=Paracoccus sp. Z118 TaxID=2851017 RepID=UPI0020B74884|nr:hexameric tyrosine-coordinated heme protein [Paracoccus sp. Z118]
MIPRSFVPVVLAASLGFGAPVLAQQSGAPPAEGEAAGMAPASAEAWLPSLITDTPEAGFDLAITMARKAVTTTQTERTNLHALRPAYAHDPDSLIQVSGVVARYFATIAEANDYWRE